MRVSTSFDLGIRSDEGEHTAEFAWESGELPLPRRGDRIWLGELVLIVDQVRYKCPDAGYLATRDDTVPTVEVDLWLRLSKRSRQCRYSPGEFHSLLSELPCVCDLFVTGIGA
jgi:hypothetical protein